MDHGGRLCAGRQSDRCAGVTFFILPSDILSGGTAGIAVALEPILHLPETLVINVLTVGLFLLGSICLGKAFFLKTVLSTLVYPVYISVLSLYFSDMVITDNQLLASIYAGICIGVGIGLVYRVDGSTGGMDIPPLSYINIRICPFLCWSCALTVRRSCWERPSMASRPA